MKERVSKGEKETGGEELFLCVEVLVELGNRWDKEV